MYHAGQAAEQGQDNINHEVFGGSDLQKRRNGRQEDSQKDFNNLHSGSPFYTLLNYGMAAVFVADVLDLGPRSSAVAKAMAGQADRDYMIS